MGDSEVGRADPSLDSLFRNAAQFIIALKSVDWTGPYRAATTSLNYNKMPILLRSHLAG